MPDPDARPEVRIVHLTLEIFEALAAGNLAAANALSPVPLTDAFTDPHWRQTWSRRASQVRTDPAAAPWVTGVIWDPRRRLAVGRAGFHAPPDDSGMVEIGYAVDPDHRRRGYARAALEALLARAAQDPDVKTVRASIRPDNQPSYNLVSQYGFTRTSEQWDDEDGLEFIYEVAAGNL